MAAQRPTFVKRSGGVSTGFALLVQAIRVAGATLGQVLVATDDGAGGVEFVPGAAGGGGGGVDAQLRIAGLHTITGSGSYTVTFARDTVTADNDALVPAPLSLPSGGAYVKGLRVYVHASDIGGNALLRVYINGVATTIAIDVTGAVDDATFTDAMHAEAVADGDTVTLVLEVNGGNTASQVFQFSAALALTTNP